MPFTEMLAGFLGNLGKFATSDQGIKAMAQTGAALGGPGSWQEALGASTVGSIKSKEAKDLLAGILGAGGKVSGDQSGLTLKIPNTQLAEGKAPVSTVSNLTPANIQQMGQQQQPVDQSKLMALALALGGQGPGYQNPFGSGGGASSVGQFLANLPADAVAALTPEEIYGTVELKARMDQAQAAQDENLLRANLAYAKQTGLSEPSVLYGDYQRAVEQGYTGTFMDYVQWYKKATAQSPEEKLDYQELLKKQNLLLDMLNPKFVQEYETKMKASQEWNSTPALRANSMVFNEIMTKAEKSKTKVNMAEVRPLGQHEMLRSFIDRSLRNILGSKLDCRVWDGWYFNGKKVFDFPYKEDRDLYIKYGIGKKADGK